MLRVKSPARICLFGEHQDYLSLPVVSMAISLYSTILGKKINDNRVIIHKKNLGEVESFSLDSLYLENKRDYYKSGILSCIAEGLEFSRGFEVEVESNIPIQAGCGSSSSIMVGWISFLTKIADQPVDWPDEKIGRIAYVSEVLNFNEPGGMMDQYSSALGGLLYLESKPNIFCEKINSDLKSFILVDSLTPKDTISILSKCKKMRLDIIKKLKKYIVDIDLSDLNIEQIKPFLNKIELDLMKGTLKNRDLLIKGLKLVKNVPLDHIAFGNSLYEGHKILRDILKTSTLKIDRMIRRAMDLGAYGGKITGSGGGGCMFVYTQENKKEIMDSIKNEGGVAYLVNQSDGVKID